MKSIDCLYFLLVKSVLSIVAFASSFRG